MLDNPNLGEEDVIALMDDEIRKTAKRHRDAQTASLYASAKAKRSGKAPMLGYGTSSESSSGSSSASASGSSSSGSGTSSSGSSSESSSSGPETKTEEVGLLVSS